MTTDQRVRLNMLLSVRNYGNQNEQTVKNIPKFASSFEKLKSTTDEIQLIGEIQGVNKTGLTSDKNKLKKSLIGMAIKNSNKVAILAKQTNNDTLLKEVRFNESQLIRLPEVKLKEQVQIIYDRTEANIGSLGEQGITPETQKIFLETITAFNKALSTPRTGIAIKREATKKLLVRFATADSLIEIMDLAAGSAKDEFPDFFNGYKTSRKLIDTNTGLLALKATAKDLASGEPIHGVLFTFIHEADKLTGSDGIEEITRKTAKKGSLNIKNMQAGTYQVTVRKPGYKQKEVSVIVAEGERSELVVELEKA
jgi:hypothetical protein